MRKIFTYIFGIILFCLSCKTQEKYQQEIIDNNSKFSIGDSLSYELCQMYGLDQGVRARGMNYFNEISKLDSINFMKLVNIVKIYGFPNENLLGHKNMNTECVSATAVCILLHNPHFLVNNKYYFDIFLEEVNKGNLERNTFATILDKYYWSKNKGKVLYGSQFGMPCIETKVETNKARLEIGLNILPDSLFSKCDK